MSERLYRLVYYSHNRVEGDPATVEEEIRQILAASRRNNGHVGVTGALMFNAGCFAQVLEGPQAAVEHTFERIQQDARHGDVQLLALKPVSERAFDDWSMAYVGAERPGASSFAGIAGESGFDPSRMTGDALFETLHALVLAEETEAA